MFHVWKVQGFAELKKHVEPCCVVLCRAEKSVQENKKNKQRTELEVGYLTSLVQSPIPSPPLETHPTQVKTGWCQWWWLIVCHNSIGAQVCNQLLQK
jgi:hypothetical protein